MKPRYNKQDDKNAQTKEDLCKFGIAGGDTFQIMTEARGLNFVDEERWSWSVSLQTQYYSTGRRILLVKPVIVIYLCEAKDRQMLMEMCTCINSPQTIIWWDMNHYYCNNRVLWRWDLLLRYIEVLKKTPFQILTKDMKTKLNAYRLCRMNEY